MQISFHLRESICSGNFSFFRISIQHNFLLRFSSGMSSLSAHHIIEAVIFYKNVPTSAFSGWSTIVWRWWWWPCPSLRSHFSALALVSSRYWLQLQLSSPYNYSSYHPPSCLSDKMYGDEGVCSVAARKYQKKNNRRTTIHRQEITYFSSPLILITLWINFE